MSGGVWLAAADSAQGCSLFHHELTLLC
eukprot:COSAG01_NODE_14407_length_1458_cov_2.484180_3_plen_27_part_01